VGDYVVDGDEYTVYKYGFSVSHVYVSYRKEPHTGGVINVTTHFRKWQDLGLELYTITDVNIFANLESIGDKPLTEVILVTGSFVFSSSDVYLDERDDSVLNPFKKVVLIVVQRIVMSFILINMVLGDLRIAIGVNVVFPRVLKSLLKLYPILVL